MKRVTIFALPRVTLWESMPGAARLNDIGKGHDCFPDTPVIAGSPNVIINGQPAARPGDEVEMLTYILLFIPSSTLVFRL